MPSHTRTARRTLRSNIELSLVLLVLVAITYFAIGGPTPVQATSPSGTVAQAAIQPSSTFDFTLSNSGSISISGISSGSTTITAQLNGGQTQPISLSCTNGLPSDSTCYFTPTTSTPSFNSTFTITIKPTTPTGTYPITVTGTGGGQTHTTTVTLTIYYPPPSGIIGGNLLSLNLISVLAPYAAIAGVAVTGLVYIGRRSRKNDQ